MSQFYSERLVMTSWHSVFASTCSGDEGEKLLHKLGYGPGHGQPVHILRRARRGDRECGSAFPCLVLLKNFFGLSRPKKKKSLSSCS